MKTKNTTTPNFEKSIARSPLWLGFFLAALALACFALSPSMQAVLPPPPPDGGYPGDNTAEGTNALFSVTTGTENTALGSSALARNTTGHGNTATGAAALENNTTAGDNTATGVNALRLNTTGGENTATGSGALKDNRTGGFNTATGSGALEFNTTGGDNTATVAGALNNNRTGGDNTASGSGALFKNTIGHDNSANGSNALYSNVTGINNTASGADALRSNITGFNNTAIGASALRNNTFGNVNIALGPGAGKDLTEGDRNIDIGNDGVAGESATIRIGTAIEQTRIFVAGIVGTTTSGGVAVFVNTDGKLGTLTSSARFKDEIKPMDKASEAIHALKPVTFRYKNEIDPQHVPQFGLVAEEVEKVNPDLIVRDKEGKPYSVRYEAVNAMLLNEFLKEHRTVQELKSVVAKQEAAAAQQQKQIEALTAGLQKVSAQLEASKPASQVVLNSQ